MIDCLLRHRELAARSPLLARLGMRQNGCGCRSYGVLTLHRPSNVDDMKMLQDIQSAVSIVAVEFPIFFPIHPRTRKNIERLGLTRYLSNSARRRTCWDCASRAARISRFSFPERLRTHCLHRLRRSTRGDHGPRRTVPHVGTSAIAVLHPAHGIGLTAALEPLHLPFTQLQQTGGFAYASLSPAAFSITFTL